MLPPRTSRGLIRLMIASAAVAAVTAAPAGERTGSGGSELLIGFASGGQSVTTRRFPYLASLRHPERGHQCGGALVAPAVIMTAAHCLDSRLDALPNPEVHVGRICTDCTEPADYQVAQTASSFVHPKWNGVIAQGSDFALLFLDRELQGPFLKVLTQAGLVADLADMDLLSFAGYGLVQDFTPSSSLQWFEIPYRSRTFCQKSYKDNNFDMTIPPDAICAGGNGKEVCKGDSGGPLLIQGANSDEDRAIAVLSGGAGGCGVETEIPAIFAALFNFVPYLENALPDNLKPSAPIAHAPGTQGTDGDSSEGFIPAPKPLPSGCSQPPLMSLLGYGACRASDRSSGTRVPSYARNVGACRAMCKEDAYCVAVEYDPSTGLCKLHRQPIVSSTGLVGSGPFGINMQDQRACYTFPDGPKRESMVLLGNGLCRTQRGSSGTFTSQFGLSLSACQEACRNRPGCLAVEYSDSTRGCELHTELITGVENLQRPFSCWTKEEDGRGPLTLLEYGGCRAKDGGLGVYSTKKATMGQCRTHCEADPGCFAMQYQDVECRLYTQPIAMTTGAPSPLVCWTYTAVSALILGYGECRTSSGGSGTYNIFTYPSIEDCKSKCRESKCVAMEYNSATMACKIHSEKVSVVEFFHAEPVTCWVMDSPAQC